MEEKKNKISLSIFISILAVLVIIIMAGFIYMQKINSDREISGLKNDAEELKTTIADLQGKLDNISNVASTNNDEEKADKESNFIVPSITTSTSKEEIHGLKYDVTAYNRNFEIKIKDGVPNIAYNSTISLNEMAEYVGLNSSNIKIDSKAKEIKGFNKKVIDVCIILDNHEPGTDTFLFLMEDGTVQYSSCKNMIQNISTQGNINELKNIIKFQKVAYTDGVSGDTTAFAIDKDNNCFDVRKYLK